MKNKIQKSSGFTLLEILLVIGIIAILASIVIIAINPNRQLAKVRDTERRVGVIELNKALTQYYIDEGHFPISLDTDLKDICVTGDSASSTVDDISCTDQADLSLLVPKYLPSIPADPTGVGYQVGLSQITNKPMVIAPLTEIGPVIAVGTTTPEVEVVSGCNDATNPDCWSNSVSGKIWGPVAVTGATNENIGFGNTDILAAITPGVDDYPAADYCDSLVYGGHDDWYLPSRNELMAGFVYEYITTNDHRFISDVPYWSSTEVSNNSAWSTFVSIGMMDWQMWENPALKSMVNRYTRCMR